MSSPQNFVRLDTVRHDASGDADSQFVLRWQACLLVAYVDMSRYLSPWDEKFKAIREKWTPEQCEAMTKLHNQMWEVLNASGFSNWDMRTHSWMMSPVVYEDELAGDTNIHDENRRLFLCLAEYLFAYRDGNDISDIDWSQGRGGIEQRLSSEQKARVLDWYASRPEADKRWWEKLE